MMDQIRYEVPPGMPLSVFQDRYARLINGVYQEYADRAKEMAIGNLSLDKEVSEEERHAFISYAVSGLIPMSGRHLQHGDDTQAGRSVEVFTNCSTAAFSFLNFYLLLNGSGVGRDYSTESCRVDWDYMPNVRLVLDGGSDDSGLVKSGAHPDFLSAIKEFGGYFDTVREASHKYDSESEDVRWIKVRDSREGWAEVIATLETAAFHRNHKDSLFIFDFSGVRGKDTPIKGMQNRPAQGPLPLMRAIGKLCTIKGTRMKAWKQAMFVDHYLAACVVMGNVRRAARMATKWWGDRDVIEFIDIKRDGFLWSANDSVLVDSEFWEQARNPRPSHGRRVFEAIVGANYYDESGEPGTINVDRINHNRSGFEKITADTYLSKACDLRLHPKTYTMIDNVLSVLKASKYPFITNPCQPSWAPTLTPSGIKKLSDVNVGDSIWSNGHFTTVTKKWSTGVKEVYRYRTTAGVFYGTEEHRIVQDGHKVPVGEATAIDVCNVGAIGFYTKGEFDDKCIIAADVLDGLVVGDGSRHLTSHHKVYLDVGSPEQEANYRASEVGALIHDPHPVKKDRARIVTTTLTADELPPLLERTVPDRFFYGPREKAASFLRGLFSANGSCNGHRVTLKTTNQRLVEQVQMMLSSLGIVSYFTTNKSKAVNWGNGTYVGKESYDVNINAYNARAFAGLVGFIQPHKTAKLMELITKVRPSVEYQKRAFDVIDVSLVSTEEVFDITVADAEHVYWSGGCLVSNCGEIVLSKFGGYCVIGDVALNHAESIEDVRSAVAITARALVRTNLMPAMYQSEVERTNRIGVGLTGIFEYAWRHFKLTFHDMVAAYDFLINGVGQQPKSWPFWMHIRELRDAVMTSATEYAASKGRSTPHTFATIKPSGTISKVMASTEAAHLPPYRHYIRWVIVEKDSDRHFEYVRRGYPTIDVSHQYTNCVVVGFPTKHPILDAMPADKVVTADEVTPEDQYKWIILLDHFWLGKENNQISYTLKYDNNKINNADYMALLLEWQPRVKCCAVMPFTKESKYAYIPEEKITQDKYEQLMSKIDAAKTEDYSDESIQCSGGSCPIEQTIMVAV